MTSTLFRHQALQAAGDGEFGNPIALMPWSWWALTGFLLTFGVATLSFLALASFPRKEAASGILSYSMGELRITAPRAGIVTAIHVKDGQRVAAGDLLAYVTTEQLLARGEVFDARLQAAIGRGRSMLEDRLAALNTSEPLQIAALKQRIHGLTQQIASLRDDLRSRQAQHRLAKESTAAAQTLATLQVYSAEQRRGREQLELSVEQAVIDSTKQALSLESQRADMSLQLAQLPSDVAQTRAGLLQSLAELDERSAQATAQGGFALIARTPGVVTALQAQLGVPVDPARPLMAIIPDGSKLQAELFVPSRAIGFVTEGQPVRLLFDAFPYTRFGPGFGTVTKLSTAVLRPEEVAAAVNVNEPVYRVIVDLRDTAMAAYGRRIPLQSGMALTADILLEERSFLDLLLDPLRAAGGRTLGGAT